MHVSFDENEVNKVISIDNEDENTENLNNELVNTNNTESEIKNEIGNMYLIILRNSS